ncbi:hypothetical protein [Sorangium sp. So ce542]|uniref:hypothetical protein n=1 Tax=Sorangium sp. So ce542 TaxID=3133316 RepID=UPI003F5DA32B
MNRCTSGRDAEALFVGGAGASDGNPGTREQPVRTLSKAVALAEAGPRRIFACAETFAEAVALPAGIALWGGLDCSRGWVYVGGSRKTVLAPVAGEIPLRVMPGQGKAVVADVRAQAARAAQPGGSSIGAMVLSGATAEILRSALIAGDGAAGADGEDGGDGRAPPGTAGSSGGDACSSKAVQGGPAVETSCETGRSVAGQGGSGYATHGEDGGDGQIEPIPKPQGLGLGGNGDRDALQCMDGVIGADGPSAEHGRGAIGPGILDLSGWLGERGQDGGDGRPGQGGGGGGGRRGGPMLCGSSAGTLQGGAGGGSGGGGGCGGKGGMGGGYGGASIGLLSLSHEVVLRQTTIETGRGGDGGNGGLAQAGGPGGPGGEGGRAAGMANGGCPGGHGGYGGHGGHGGGGLGGPSIGIAHLNVYPVAQEGVIVRTGLPGQGGFGGNPAVPGSTGAEGVSVASLGFPQAH